MDTHPVISDQRMMSGPRIHRETDEVVAFWHEHAGQMIAGRGYAFSERRDSNEFRNSRRTLQPYLNHSRWVADCPECRGGIALWRDHGKAACLDCGTIYSKVAWPSPADLKAVERAVTAVPDETQRNWRPQQESAKDAVRRHATLTPEPEEERLARELKLSPATIRKVLDAADGTSR